MDFLTRVVILCQNYNTHYIGTRTSALIHAWGCTNDWLEKGLWEVGHWPQGGSQPSASPGKGTMFATTHLRFPVPAWGPKVLAGSGEEVMVLGQAQKEWMPYCRTVPTSSHHHCAWAAPKIGNFNRSQRGSCSAMNETPVRVIAIGPLVIPVVQS